MTKNETLTDKHAHLAALIEQALRLSDDLKQPMTGVYLDQALNAALAEANEL